MRCKRRLCGAEQTLSQSGRKQRYWDIAHAVSDPAQRHGGGREGLTAEQASAQQRKAIARAGNRIAKLKSLFAVPASLNT